jgi:pimeloyl-ACP methyl ester carboxylesterase
MNRRVIRLLILGYVLLCGVYYAYQHLLYFQPKALDAKHVFTFPVRMKFSSVKIPFDGDTQIDVVKFNADSEYVKPKGVVLFFHGNRFNVEHYSTYAPYFTKHGYEVWMPDYPGYGRSTGEIEAGILNDLSIQLYQMARQQFEPGQIIIYGKSLGTGIASYLASERDCRHLILETPYYSLSSLTQSYAWFLPIPMLIRYNLKTGEHFEEISAPVTVMAAEDDELIPLDNTLRLLPKMKKDDQFVVIKGAKHNSLADADKYHQIIHTILNQ